MSLVGTRPILQDELQKYELHHRATVVRRSCGVYPGYISMVRI